METVCSEGRFSDTSDLNSCPEKQTKTGIGVLHEATIVCERKVFDAAGRDLMRSLPQVSVPTCRGEHEKTWEVMQSARKS